MVATDSSELRAFAADLRHMPEALNRHAHKIVERGALNIKNAMVKDMSASTHFKPVAPTISYDVRVGGWGDTAAIEAEIGPDKARGGGRRRGERTPGVRFNEGDFRGSGKSAAALANIAYFGGARSGGGTVRDPQSVLDAERDEFIAQLDALVEEVFPR